MNESMHDPLLHSRPESDATVNESMDWLSYFRPEPDATVVEFIDHVSGDAAEQNRILVAQASSEGSTIEPMALEALREELNKAQLTIKDSLAAASALRSEMNSLSALVTEMGAEYSRVQETARECGAAVEQRLGAIELRLGPLRDLEDVRREIEKRFDALNALAQEVRANIDAVNRQQGRVEQFAVETTAQLQQREQRDVELGREMARLQSATVSALKSEMDSLSARATEIGAAYRRVQETALAALQRGATVEQRLGAIQSRLGALGDREDVRREIEKRFDALNALAQEVRANTDAVNRQRGQVEQLAVETTRQLQQREQRDVKLKREMARLRSVQAFTESAWRRVWELVDRLEAGGAADAIRSPRAAPRGQRSLTIRNVAWCVERGRTALRANVRRSSLSLLGARNAAWRVERRWPVAIGNLRRRWLSRHVAEAMANLRIPKTSVPIKYVAVAAVFTVLALMSAFVLHSVGRTADLVGPSVVTPTAPVPSNAVPVLPSATSATTSSEGSLDSATTVQSRASTRQAASAEFETPATPRATEFVGTLSIRSTPDKAEVHIDRERVGETPLVLRRVRAGSHAIWIEHEGYQRWTAGVNVPADERTQLTVTLQAESGR